MLSDVCLSVAYIGPKSRTERHRKTKIGTEVAHVTHDSDTTLKVRRSKVKVTGAGHIVAASRLQHVYITAVTTCLCTHHTHDGYSFGVGASGGTG